MLSYLTEGLRKVEKNYPYGYCGIYCGQCANGNGKVKIMAGELKRLVDIVRYEWLELPDVKPGFKFTEFRKGLEWFAAPNAQNVKREADRPSAILANAAKKSNSKAACCAQIS
jgi:hypothetical protein